VGEASRFLLELRLEEGLLGADEVYERLAAWARQRGIAPVGEKIPPKERKPR
jgi:hypothetical protein